MNGHRRVSTGWLQAVLLDWDGTLLDSFEADAAAFLALFRHFGVGWGVRELVQHYSPDWHRVYRAAGLPRERWAEADRVWRRAYARQQPALRAGARRLVRALSRRYRLALVSGGHRNRVCAQVRRFGLAPYFATVVCRDDTRMAKPHPAPLRLALRRLGLSPLQSVYVGDAPEDVQMARRAGLAALGVLGPFPVGERLAAAQPDALVERLEEIPPLLERWAASAPPLSRLRRAARAKDSAA
jgi:pyrophosphatase PpaX